MRKNRILAVLLCLALAAGLVYGIGRAFAASRRKVVVVVPVTDLNYAWGDYQNSMEGMVASGFSQDIYLMDTESVDSVLVETGQHVKEGDILLKYDATQTSINLEREILSREKLQLQMDVASKNLATLNKIKPASDGGGGDEPFPDFPDFPDTPGPEDNTPDYSGVEAARKLDQDSLPYNLEEDTEETPMGSEFNPYRYLCSDETVITGEFLNRIRQEAMEKSAAQGGTEEAHVPVYCVLEVRDGNKTDGALKRAWIMDAAALEEAPEGWEGSVNLSGRVKDKHSEAEAVDRLDRGAEPYNKDDGSESDPLGSSSNPMRFLCRGDAVITADFLNEMAEKTGPDGEGVHYVLEIRDGDTAGGGLLVSWHRQSSPEETFEEGKEYVLSFTLNEKEAGPEDPGTGEEGGQGEQGGQGTENPGGGHSPQGSGEEGEGQTPPGGSESGGEEPSGEPSGEAGQGQEEPSLENEDLQPAGVSFLSGQGRNMSLILEVGGRSRVVMTAAPQAGGLIPSDAFYTKEELEQARKDAEKEIRDLTLDLRESDLAVKAARRALDEGVVKAQMDGIVGTVNDPENPPTDGSPFLTVISESGQYIQSALNEYYLGTVNAGDTVYMMSYMNGSSFEGTVKSVSPYPDTTGRFGYYGNEVTYYPMIISVTDPTVTLNEGDYLEVRADQSSSMTDPGEGGKLYVFKAFIQDENGRKYMYKDDNGKLVRQDIMIGGMSGESYEVLSGITADDYVAFPYGSSVREGARTRQGTMDELYQ